MASTTISGDIGISCKPFRRFPCLISKMVLLSLPSVHLRWFMEFWWSLAQPHFPYDNQGYCKLKNYAPRCSRWCSRRNFCQSRLVFPVCMTWYRVLFLDEAYFSNHPLDPGEHYHLQELDAGLCVESDGTWEDEWRHNITIISDHPNTIMKTGCLVFIDMNMNLSIDWHSIILKFSYMCFRIECRTV